MYHKPYIYTTVYIYIYIYINANTEGNVYIRSDKSSQRKGLHILYWALIPEGEYQYGN